MTVRLPKGVKKAGAQAKKTQSGKAGVVGPPKPVARKKSPQAKKITTLRAKVQTFRGLYGPLGQGQSGTKTPEKGPLVAPWENYGTLPGTSVLKLGGEDEKAPGKGGGKRKKRAKQTKRRKRAETGRSKAGTRRKY